MSELASLSGEVRLPWGAWDGHAEMVLQTPPEWRIELLRMAGGPPLPTAEMERALAAPIGAPAIESLAAGARSAAIAIDDATRPAKTAPVLQLVVARLRRAGMPASAIHVVIACGAHRRPTARDIELKVGADVLQSVQVVSHDPTTDLIDSGVSLGGVPVRINRTFASADLRVGISGVMPHPFAGFSGGGKIVIPGLADLETLVRTHKYALMGFRGGAGLAGNRFRSDMEEAVRAIGLHWSVNLVVNEVRDTAFLAAGDFVEAHRAAAAQRIGWTLPPSGLLDALVLNAYPKDTELLQIEASLTALRSGIDRWLAPGAPIVLTAACPDGLGTHGLFGPGGRLFRKPAKKTFLGDRPLIIFCPSVDPEAAAAVFWSGYPACREWNGVVSQLKHYLRPGARVGVLPCAPLQIAGEGNA